MIGKAFLVLVMVAVVAMLVAVGFQVFTLMTSEHAERVVASDVVKVQTPAPGRPVLTNEPAKAEAQDEKAEPVPAIQEVVPAELPVVPPLPVKIAKASSSRELAGEVVMVVGKVVVVGSDGAERLLELDNSVFIGDRMVSSAGAKLKLALKDGTALWLGETSEVTLDRYVYDPVAKDKNSCVLRFLKGACRVLTGAITSLNPDGFRVRTRMATVGIRGCETGFKSSASSDEVYVIGLGSRESVVVEATSDGSPVMDSASGEQIDIEDSRKMKVNVTEQGLMVAIVSGKGVSTKRLGAEDIRSLVEMTSHLPPAKFDMITKPDGAVIVVEPESEAAGVDR